MHSRVVFLYITTVNVFLAQLNLSKQHTPTWAVKRADQDMRERTEKKSHTLSDFVQNKEKNVPCVFWKEQEKRVFGETRELQSGEKHTKF